MYHYLTISFSFTGYLKFKPTYVSTTLTGTDTVQNGTSSVDSHMTNDLILRELRIKVNKRLREVTRIMNYKQHCILRDCIEKLIIQERMDKNQNNVSQRKYKT